MMKIPFIAIEGPIGAGKSSLAKQIQQQNHFHLLEEIVEENPYLEAFYDDQNTWSFQTEMFFLCNRFKQIEDMKKKMEIEKQPIVADYHIMKNLIFARLNLTQEMYAKYEQIFHILFQDLPLPNFIIYIDASVETLMKRIAMRNRSFEQNMDPDYLSRLRTAYQHKMNAWQKLYPEIPLIRIDGDTLDYIADEDARQFIHKQIHEQLTKGGFFIDQSIT